MPFVKLSGEQAEEVDLRNPAVLANQPRNELTAIEPGNSLNIVLIGSTATIEISYRMDGSVEIVSEAPRRNIPEQRTRHHMSFHAEGNPRAT